MFFDVFQSGKIYVINLWYGLFYTPTGVLISHSLREIFYVAVIASACVQQSVT